MPRKKADNVNDEANKPLAEDDAIPTTQEVTTVQASGAPRGNTPLQSFFGLDFNELDRDLSPDQLKEWTAIYASYRSRTPLTGTIAGVDTHNLSVTDPVTKKAKNMQILCLVVMDYRVKVIIPYTEIWYDSETVLPDYVIRRMIGAEINYVITNVDRLGECAIASRRQALGYERNRFYRDGRRNEPGQIQTCNILVVGPNRIIAECNGFDLHLGVRDLSYTAISDLRTIYRPGQKLNAKLLGVDRDAGTIDVSVKEVNPNPFDGADKRHPVGSMRQAKISGKYAGGLFCTMADDTTCLCLYSPGYFNDDFYIDDSVLVLIIRYDYARKLIYGKLLPKL